jgi:hypothetical protein
MLAIVDSEQEQVARAVFGNHIVPARGQVRITGVNAGYINKPLPTGIGLCYAVAALQPD